MVWSMFKEWIPRIYNSLLKICRKKTNNSLGKKLGKGCDLLKRKSKHPIIIYIIYFSSNQGCAIKTKYHFPSVKNFFKNVAKYDNCIKKTIEHRIITQWQECKLRQPLRRVKIHICSDPKFYSEQSNASCSPEGRQNSKKCESAN